MCDNFAKSFIRIVVFLFMGQGSLLAQDHITDSLENRLKQFPVSKFGERDTNRIKLLNAISFRCKGSGQYEKGHYYTNQVIDLLSASGATLSKRDSAFLGEAYTNKGLLYFRQGKNDSAIYADNKAISIWKSLDDQYGYSTSLSHLSVVYDDQGNYSKALEYIFSSLTIRQTLKDERAVASMYGNIGEIYRKMNDTAKAMEYHQKSLELARAFQVKEPNNQNNKRVIGNALNNIAILYERRHNYDQSIVYHRESLKIRTEVGDKSAIAASLNNLGSDFQEQGKFDTAIAYFNRAFVIKSEIGDKRGISICYMNFAGINYLKKEYKQAQSNLDSSLYYCNLVGVPELKLEILRSYSECLTAAGNPAKALEFFKTYIDLRDSLKSEENTRDAMRAEAAYTFGLKSVADSTRQAQQTKIKDLENEEKIRKQRTYTIGGIVGFILMLVVALVSFRAYRQKQLANVIISEQKDLVDAKQREILDSINYAKRIQFALLAQSELLENNLQHHFVLFRPKDIVSGDFYWATKIGSSKFYLAVCDSTGHGVPGAFMSLLNISFLNEAVIEKEIEKPGEVLDFVRKRLIGNAKESSESSAIGQDGMDGTLVCLDQSSKKLTYASAFNTPLLIRDGNITLLSVDKMPVGQGVRAEHFTTHELDLLPGDVFYLYTDGFADQFGGAKGKKYKYKKLNEFLLEIHQSDCNSQRQKLESEFDIWKGNLEQIDDVCIVGFKIS